MDPNLGSAGKRRTPAKVSLKLTVAITEETFKLGDKHARAEKMDYNQTTKSKWVLVELPINILILLGPWFLKKNLAALLKISTSCSTSIDLRCNCCRLPGHSEAIEEVAKILHYMLVKGSGLSLGPDCDGVLNFMDADFPVANASLSEVISRTKLLLMSS